MLCRVSLPSRSSSRLLVVNVAAQAELGESKAQLKVLELAPEDSQLDAARRLIAAGVSPTQVAMAYAKVRSCFPSSVFAFTSVVLSKRALFFQIFAHWPVDCTALAPKVLLASA